MAGELARGVLLQQGEKADPPTPMQLDVIARVEGLHWETQGSLSGCSRRSVTTWTASIKSVSTRMRQDANSQDLVGRTQASYRTEAAS